MKVQLDLNFQAFQQQFVLLDNENALALRNTLKKLLQLEWNQVYRDSGLNWELVQGQPKSAENRFYTIRITQKFRAVVSRDGAWMVFHGLYTDHDGAYS